MSIAEKLTTIAENEQKVFDAGKQTESGAFWNGFTNNGKRINYANGFQRWGHEYIRPTTKIVLKESSSGNQTFDACSNLKIIEKAYFDFSQKLRGVNNQQAWYATFNACATLETIEDIGMQADYEYCNTFAYCEALHTIEVLRTDEQTKWAGTFNSCNSLQNITIEGTIAQNGFDIHYSTKLTKASLISILEACNVDVKANPITVTLPAKCIDGATDTETLLNSSGGDFETTIYTYGASTIQLPHTNIKPNTVRLIPVDENGTQIYEDWRDDGNGNIINPWYPGDTQIVGTINYATGFIDVSSSGTFGELRKYMKCQYTAVSAYELALSRGYNIAFS